MLAMADGHQTNYAGLAIDGVDDSKAADAIFSQPIQFTLERLSAFRVVRNRTNCGFDGLLQVRMERPENLSHMRRDVGSKRCHTVRRFLRGVIGLPKTSSKDKPFFLDR